MIVIFIIYLLIISIGHIWPGGSCFPEWLCFICWKNKIKKVIKKW